MNEYSFSLLGIFQVVRGYWKSISIFVGLSSAVGIAIAFYLKPYYKSTCSIYTLDHRAMVMSSTLGSSEIDDNMFAPLGGANLRIGTPDDVDQVMGALMSEKVRMQIIQEFGLYQKYNIKPEHPKAKAKMLSILEDNLKIKRTSYNTLEISVWETEPELAQKIANRFATLANEVYSGIFKTNMEKIATAMQEEYQRKSVEIQQLSDSLNKLKKQNINPAHQIVLEQLLIAETKQLSKYKTVLEMSKMDKKYTLDNAMILDEAQPNGKRDRPKRALIILGFALSGLGIGVLFAILKHNLNRVHA
ncbi:MAG: hypothetical protein NZ519_04445 [Bacteroidia bacterium]|nr:hypothetical protein [Bacteroidia bacterium]MDW8301926.1 hypothetical protein [Bacteroidia bacterium]